MEEKKRRKESLQKQCLKCKQDEKPSRSSSPVSFPGPSKSVRSTSEPGKYTAMMSIGRQQEEGKIERSSETKLSFHVAHYKRDQGMKLSSRLFLEFFVCLCTVR